MFGISKVFFVCGIFVIVLFLLFLIPLCLILKNLCLNVKPLYLAAARTHQRVQCNRDMALHVISAVRSHVLTY
jgi:hypothetical protein